MKLFNLARFRSAKQGQPNILPTDRTIVPPAAPPASASLPCRAFVLLKSRRRLDLLDLQPEAWSDEDLATGLSRVYRWAGASKWDLPLSVAQHSLTVLALREAEGPLTAREALRELLHDATEFMLGWDCIASLKPQLGAPFARLDQRLQTAVNQRYRLPAWTDDAYARHKRADRLAAASEAFHVVGWSRQDMREALTITLDPLTEDPLVAPAGFAPWEPWPPALAERLFLSRLNILLARDAVDDALAALAPAFSRLPRSLRRRVARPPAGNSLKDLYVHVEAPDGSGGFDGVVVDGARDEDGDFDLEADFTIFTTDDKADGELIRVNGASSHVEQL